MKSIVVENRAKNNDLANKYKLICLINIQIKILPEFSGAYGPQKKMMVAENKA